MGKRTEFSFNKVETAKGLNGSIIAILTLAKPIDDISIVYVHEDQFNDTNDFQWDENKEIGHYKGKLKFEVLPSNDQVTKVWLR